MNKTPDIEKFSTKEPSYLDGKFKLTTTFNSNLPLLSLFTLRSPKTKLVVSPVVNHRQVSTSNFLAPNEISGKTFAQCVKSTDDDCFTTTDFCVYPYQVANNNKIMKLLGAKVESICSGTVEIDEKPKSNTTVRVEDCFAYEPTKKLFDRTMVLLDRPRVYTNAIQNWIDMFWYEDKICDNDSLKQWLKHVDLSSLTFIQETKSFECNMRMLQQFFSICSVVSLSFPEGQHRIEAISRPGYGYGLLQNAPLIPVSPNLPEDELYKEKIAMLYTESPLHAKCHVYFLLPKESTNPGSIDTTKLGTVSAKIQELSRLQISTTYIGFFKTCFQNIQEALSRRKMRVFEDGVYRSLDGGSNGDY